MTESLPPEKFIYAFEFQSHLSLRQIFQKLEEEAFDEIKWSTRESEYDGVYILGRQKVTQEHEIKIRIVEYTTLSKSYIQTYELEVYFPLDAQLQSVVLLSEKQNILQNKVPNIIRSLTSANSSAG